MAARPAVPILEPDFRPLPMRRFQGDRRDVAVDVVERLDQQAIAGAVHAGQRNALGRLEEYVEPAGAAKEVVDRLGEKGALAVRLASDGPVAPQGKEEPVAKEAAQGGVLGHVEPDQAIAEKDGGLMAEE